MCCVLVVIFVGISSLLVPVNSKRRHVVNLSAAFNDLCNRLLLAWLILYAVYLNIQTTYFPDAHWIRNLLFSFPGAVKSPFGFIGLCSAVCFTSSLAWSTVFYIVRGSLPVRDEFQSAVYGFFIVLHMIFLAVIVPQLDDVTIPQMAPFFVIKVFVFHVVVRLLPLIDSILLSSEYGGTTTEDRAFIVLYCLAHVTVFIFSTIQVVFNNIQLAAWTSFPVCLTEGFVMSIMAGYILKLAFERLRGWLWNSEGNMDVLLVVSITSKTNLNAKTMVYITIKRFQTANYSHKG